MHDDSRQVGLAGQRWTPAVCVPLGTIANRLGWLRRADRVQRATTVQRDRAHRDQTATSAQRDTTAGRFQAARLFWHACYHAICLPVSRVWDYPSGLGTYKDPSANEGCALRRTQTVNWDIAMVVTATQSKHFVSKAVTATYCSVQLHCCRSALPSI